MRTFAGKPVALTAAGSAAIVSSVVTASRICTAIGRACSIDVSCTVTMSSTSSFTTACVMVPATGTAMPSAIVDPPMWTATWWVAASIDAQWSLCAPTMVISGEEGATNPSQTLYIINNTFVNDRGSGTFVELAGGTTATLRNNLIVGNGTLVSGGTVTQVSNLRTSAPNFVNPGAFDYRPTAATPGIDQGTAPGLGGTFDLRPSYQYVHPRNRETRPTRNGIDIGAYEFTP